jgi:hypothetical protein
VPSAGTTYIPSSDENAIQVPSGHQIGLADSTVEIS